MRVSENDFIIRMNKYTKIALSLVHYTSSWPSLCTNQGHIKNKFCRYYYWKAASIAVYGNHIKETFQQVYVFPFKDLTGTLFYNLNDYNLCKLEIFINNVTFHS